MKSVFSILFFIFFSTISLTQDSVKVTINLHTDNKYTDDGIYIVGSIEQLGNWNPSAVKLNKINDTTFSREFLLGKNTPIEFKFTRGSWQKEALNDDGRVMQNIMVNTIEDVTLTYNIKFWKDYNPIKSEITGTVEYHRNMKGDGIRDRDVIVWLPRDYEKNVDKTYPVLYVHDAQNAFDPSTSTMGYDWQIDETADSLIKNNIIEEIIIVAMNNTEDRFAEYSNSELGYKYVNFLVNTLKPYIDSNYRTKKDPEHTGTFGSSMGGLISFIIAWEHPDVFGLSACFSPAFKIKNLDYTKLVEEYDGPKKKIKFYIDNGGVGLEAELQPGIDDMLKLLGDKGYEEGKDIIWRKFEDAEHNESAWAKRVHIPLEFFFKR